MWRGTTDTRGGTIKLPSKLKDPSQVTAIVNTREQLPLCLDPLRVQTGTLDTGDYSLAGCEHLVRIERKSLDDLLGCVGSQRE
jgi:ERCC4-type nuclease